MLNPLGNGEGGREVTFAFTPHLDCRIRIEVFN